MKSFSVLLLSLFSLASVAQTPKPEPQQADATHSSSVRVQPALLADDGIAQITLGQSVYPLNGPWKFTIGDSPIDPATHQPLWAEPSFDDSHWETVDLTPPAGSFDPIAGISGYVPGWTAKGHPGYSGYAWYRIRVKVNAPLGEKLSLAGPTDVDDAFQVFANGSLLGSFGDFSASHPVTYSSRPTHFPLSSSVLSHDPDGTQVLAFRLWMEPSTPLDQADSGGFHDAPQLGQAGAVAAGYQVGWLGLIRTYALGAFQSLLFLLLTVLAFSLTLFDRSDKVYYWIAAAFLLQAADYIVLVTGVWSYLISGQTQNILLEAVFVPLILAVWVMVWWVWFQLKRPAWLPKTVIVFTLLYMVGDLLGGELIFGLVSHPVAVKFHLLSACVRLAFLALLLLIVVLGIRQQGREGWLAVPAIVLLGISRFQTELRVLHILSNWFTFGMQITPGTEANFLLVFAIFILLLRRMFVSLRVQRERALDIKQAAEIQQVILPESHFTFPGLAIETEYRPAREVGGDFFQLIPHPTDGSVLIVAGDVTGKGLQAGMLVALLVGAIRSTAELNPDPLFLLQALNRRLLGRRSAQATCLALRIAANGSATLANAGHLPPYLNGKPLDMQGALPLGIIDGADFSVMHFQLTSSEKLVVISDGILEATDAHGQLFGFDRVAELLRSSAPVKALADAAQLFGQNDDISLVAVTRTA
ncbi:PP2C family protein-serine/threonine phosphatase [Granulicella sp. S190]|uniref:PP2C family protein-serine/threonine phosphatase n=1 Tax=Granulicella sp. S190 TaxID=1747226 RepID=UPI00131E333B|nr:PP2C family protein-serine/threonine phosphatase [Granulicella sp. S190]